MNVKKTDAYKQLMEQAIEHFSPNERALLSRVFRAYGEGGGNMKDLISFVMLVSRGH